MKGKLIVIEGVDGAGKSTLARRVARALTAGRRRVLQTREPGGTPVGERIRRVLLDSRNDGLTALGEIFLYMAARAQVVEEVLLPSLRSGIHVVLDRYYHSSAAYQGGAGGLGVDTILDLAEKTARFPKPDLVVLLDLPPKAARARRKGRPDRVEKKGLAYQDRVRRAFRAMARRDRRRFLVLDARKSADAVFDAAWERIRRAV